MKKNLLMMAIVAMNVMGIFAQQTVTLNKLSNPIIGGSLLPTAAGVIAWGDYNNDGLLDAFIAAGQGASTSSVALYKNNGNNTFTDIYFPFYGNISRASAVWIDYNNDGNLDLVITGSFGGIEGALVYKNMGASQNYEFEEDSDNSYAIAPVAAEDGDKPCQMICAFDYNNDGWMDLIMAGNNQAGWNTLGRVIALFKNNNGKFEWIPTPVGGNYFSSISGSAVQVGDANNDGYADILVGGWLDSPASTIAEMYINDKNGGFTKASAPAFTGNQTGDAFFIDVNNDGWQDIIEIGHCLKDGSWPSFVDLWINNHGSFTKISDPFPGNEAASVCLGDVNNDGNMDIVVHGWGTNAKFLYGKGDGTFMESLFSNADQARSGSLSLVDFTNDGTLDLTQFGWSDTNGSFVNNFYRLSGAPTNKAPNALSKPTASYANEKYTLSWAAASDATDDITKGSAIRYNVAVKNLTTGAVYSYIPADLTTGKVKVNNGCQPFLTVTSFELNLPKGNYSFGVQAIDQMGLGSPFAWTDIVGIAGINPTNVKVFAEGHNLHIDSNETVAYQIMSVSGQTIASGSSVKANVAVQSGVYLVKTVQNGAVNTTKILVY